MIHNLEMVETMRDSAGLLGDSSILATVDRHASERPDKPFLIIETTDGPHVISFLDLLKRAHGFADLFTRHGLRRDDPVALMFTTHPALAPAFLGAMIAGAVPFVLPTMTTKQNPLIFWKAQCATLERVGARLILTDTRTASSLVVNAPDFAELIIDVDKVDLRGTTVAATFPSRSLDDIAFLQHSSGTTGAKKGVILTHGMVLKFAHALHISLDLSDTDVIASWLPLYHDMGLIGSLMLPMLIGLTTVHVDPFEWAMRPVTMFEIIERYRATICWQPNFAFQHLIRTLPRNHTANLSSIRALIDCSEPCKPDTLEVFRKRFATASLRPEAVQVSYGMAENVFTVTQTTIGAIPRVIEADRNAIESGWVAPPQEGSASIAFISNGRAIPGTRISILDADHSPLGEQRVGQIAITSPYLFPGYHRSDLAAGKILNGWYHTGDFGFLDDGELFILGRRDELLIINGRNVYAHDVEFSVNRNTAVKPGRCVAVGPYNHRTGSRALVVIAETDETIASARHELAQAVRAAVLSEFGILTQDVLVADVGWLEKTTSGKIARGANETKYLALGRLG